MEEKEIIKLLKLSDEDKVKEVKKLRKELKVIKDCNVKYKNQIEQLRDRIINEYTIECKLNILTHQFQRKDIVVLKSHEIAEIENLRDVYHYDMFIHDSSLRGGIGTKRKVHNKDILCHITDLNLEYFKNLKYKQRGFRRINYLNK